jgi:hypothetical protein
MSAFGGKAGSAAAIWPLAARAQQGERVRHIGVLMSLAADDKEGQARLAAFLQGLQELGWIDGRNVRVDTRWGGGDGERARKYIAELVALTPDVILASGGSLVAPLLQATRTVPIVFTQTPVVEIKLGFDHRLLHSCFRDGVEDAYAPTSDSCEPAITRAVSGQPVWHARLDAFDLIEIRYVTSDMVRSSRKQHVVACRA